MAIGDLVTQPYQFEYSGFVMGTDTNTEVMNIKGLIGYGALRNGTVTRFGNHGGVGGKHYMDARQFIVQFDAVPASEDEYGILRQQWMTAFRPRTLPQDEEPFVFWLPGASPGKLQIEARPIDYNFDIDRDFALFHPQPSVRFEATDPFHYTVQEYTQQIALSADTTGLVFPLVFPLDFGAATSNEAGLINGGSASATWTAVIAGLIEGPRIEVSGGEGQTLNLPNLTVPAGETLEINERRRSFLLNGEQNVRQFLTKASRWFKLDPISPTNPTGNTTVRFAANGASSGATITFTWRWAYWGEG
jgi:hypothetical protein